MKKFEDYYTDEKIIKLLCKIRISYARRRSKKHLLDNLTTSEFHLEEKLSDYDNEILSVLSQMLPNRRLWLTRGQRTFNKSIKIDTDDKNREILFNTIKKYRRDYPTTDFVISLNKFIEEIITSINSCEYKFSSPDILPEIKERKKSALKYQAKNGIETECRPIARFKLKDRIILSLVNKFFTDLFDDFFEGSALAFRAVKKNDKGEIVITKHHDAVEKIIAHKEKNQNSDFFVAECDIKKFYDSVNHKVCLDEFNKLIEKAKAGNTSANFDTAIYLFKAYLECYSFQDDVLTKNGCKTYWDSQKDKKGNSIRGRFPWIEKEIAKSEYYNKNSTDKIGVPQGGALSGLIANIVLDATDKKLKEIDELFYVRYCDDMILMHQNKQVCRDAINLYINSINDLLLFNHDLNSNYFKQSKQNYSKSKAKYRVFPTSNGKQLNRAFEYTTKPFWECKSKGPFKWGKLDLKNNCFPWISFVGYEINYNGETRIRKKSLKKELEKQEKVIKSIIYAISNKKNARNKTIIRSAYEKLHGMAVGRIKIYNYKTCENKLCWTDGFRQLNFNKYSKQQLRLLDRNKYHQIAILTKSLKTETIKSIAPEEDNNSEIYFFHKPFSYYYQAGQKKQELKCLK